MNLSSLLSPRLPHHLSSALARCRAALLACAIAFGLCAAVPPAEASQNEKAFTQAVEQYRQGRWSAAFGAFTSLAERGDADAARIVLFMLRYGPVLHGSYWDAPTEDVEYWNNLSASGLGRAQPVFKPATYTDPTSVRNKVELRATPTAVAHRTAEPKRLAAKPR